MKQSYIKPVFAVELFSMTQTSARDCSDFFPIDQINATDIANCGWDLGGGSVVFSLQHACNIDGEQMGIACYNNPSEGNYIFRS